MHILLPTLVPTAMMMAQASLVAGLAASWAVPAMMVGAAWAMASPAVPRG
jgi:hypothetical protein